MFVHLQTHINKKSMNNGCKMHNLNYQIQPSRNKKGCIGCDVSYQNFQSL